MRPTPHSSPESNKKSTCRSWWPAGLFTTSKGGDRAVIADEVVGVHAPNIMKQNLIYRGPEPSHATRTISRRSRASLRGAMVAKLPGFNTPRILQLESALEYAFLCLTLVRDDIQHIWDQPPVVHYVGRDGRTAKHIFDFLVTKTDGERIAVAVKPMQRVIERNFLSELERVAAATPKQFADRVMLVTDRHLDRAAAAAAARKLVRTRPALAEVAA